MKENKNDGNKVIETFQHIDLLYRGKATEKKLSLERKVEKALRGRPESLKKYLGDHPGIIEDAKARIYIDCKLHEENPFYPFPYTKDEIEVLSGPLKFGRYNPNGDIFGIGTTHLNLNTIVVGRAQSGKSNLNLIALSQLLGTETFFNIIIIDLKKEYRCLLPGNPNLKIITFRNLSFNPLEVPEWQDPRDHINNFAEVFCRENYILAFGKNMLISTVEYIYKQRGIFEGKKSYPTFKDLFNVINAQGKGGAKIADAKASLISRIKPYIDYPDVFCCKSFPFNTWLQNNTVIELENITNDMYATVTNLIVSLIYNYYHKMNLRGSQVRTLFVVDEAGVLFNSMRDRNIQFGDSYINSLVRRGGEFGLGFWVTSQEPTTLSQAIHSNSILKFMFPLVEANQLKIMGLSMALREEQKEFAFTLPPQGTCIVRYGYFPRPFLLDVPLFEGKKEVGDDFVEEKMKNFYREITPKKETEEVVTRHESSPVQGEVPEEAHSLLIHIANHPFDKLTEHREKFTIGAHRFDKAREWLRENKHINEEKIKITKGKSRPSVFLVLMPKALNLLNIKQHFGKGGFRHQIYCHLIEKWLRKRGWNVKIEASNYPSDKLIDVIAKKDGEVIGYEVTLHFENLQSNIDKDLKILDVLIIVVEQKNIDKAQKGINDYGPSLSPGKQVKIQNINDFFE